MTHLAVEFAMTALHVSQSADNAFAVMIQAVVMMGDDFYTSLAVAMDRSVLAFAVDCAVFDGTPHCAMMILQHIHSVDDDNATSVALA